MKKMKKVVNGFPIILTLLLAGVLVINCKKDDPAPAPTTGKVTGTVTKLADATALADVSVFAFDAATNAPVMTVKTDPGGKYSLDLSGGTYFFEIL